MKSNFFYCYSFRLSSFLLSLGFNYAFKGINTKSKDQYIAFNKSDKLDMALAEWDTIKNKFKE